jgi:hypothetical protein
MSDIHCLFLTYIVWHLVLLQAFRVTRCVCEKIAQQTLLLLKSKQNFYCRKRGTKSWTTYVIFKNCPLSTIDQYLGEHSPNLVTLHAINITQFTGVDGFAKTFSQNVKQYCF